MIILNFLNNLNDIGEKIKNIEFNLGEGQERFLETTIGKIANSVLDIGLKKVLPDFLENDVIEIKDVLFNEGFSECIDKTVENAINLGKTAMGIITGNFENIEQAEKALEKGGLLEKLSEGLDYVLEKLEKNKIISNQSCSLIKKGTDLIFDMLNKKIKNEFLKEKEIIKKIGENVINWEKSYLAKDTIGVNNYYNEIKEKIEEVMPIESVLNNFKLIENVNKIINNSNDFNYDPMYLELAKKI